MYDELKSAVLKTKMLLDNDSSASNCSYCIVSCKVDLEYLFTRLQIIT